MLTTPIGDLWITVSQRGVYAISRAEPPAGAQLDPDAVVAVAAQLSDYFAGERQAFDLELDLAAVTRFDAAVWAAARGIPYGETASYGELAAMAGYPRAARAAGGAMARCRLFPIIPCHRVIQADGSIGGWGGETWVKRWLLEMEAAGASTSSQGSGRRLHL
jgi:methylated-DNA-[protein]-cysteine S-methyltransferase